MRGEPNGRHYLNEQEAPEQLQPHEGGASSDLTQILKMLGELHTAIDEVRGQVLSLDMELSSKLDQLQTTLEFMEPM